jgi:hypothetical protein
MPKLLIFAACEKVLLDQNTNSISLIALLQEVHFKVPQGAPLVPNASLPMQWAAISVWQEETPADSGVEFEQRVALENAAGQLLLENVAKWHFEKSSHRIVANVLGLPIARKLALSLTYRVAGMRDWLPAASFPIEVLQDVL